MIDFFTLKTDVVMLLTYNNFLMKEENEMKKWNTPVIQELNLSNTEAGTARSGYVDKVIWSVEEHINYQSYSGNGKKATDNYHTTPADGPQP